MYSEFNIFFKDKTVIPQSLCMPYVFTVTFINFEIRITQYFENILITQRLLHICFDFKIFESVAKGKLLDTYP